MIVAQVLTKEAIDEVLATPQAEYSGIMPHPTLQHHYILLFVDKDGKTIAHRVADAARIIGHLHQVLCLIDQLSVETMSSMLQLNANADDEKKGH